MTGTPQPHPPKQLRHGRRREATLCVPWRTFLVWELEDRFLRIVCCGRVVYRGNVLFGTVCSPPLVTYQRYLPLWLFQHPDSGHNTSLEPPTHFPRNAVACIDMENRIVLGGDITEDVRVYERSHPHLCDSHHDA